MSLDGATSLRSPDCVFCDASSLSHVLAETAHFRVVADFAPLAEGHTLIMPRSHYPCYGALPLELEPELVSVKRRVARFFRLNYRPAVFFEHGVFRQTVFHAHLHAFPFGPIDMQPLEVAHADGRLVQGLADVRAWYNERGHYFYLEQPRQPERDLEAAVFPPEEEHYFRVLGRLREQTERAASWMPPAVRRVQGGPQVRELARKWATFEPESSSGAP